MSMLVSLGEVLLGVKERGRVDDNPNVTEFLKNTQTILVIVLS